MKFTSASLLPFLHWVTGWVLWLQWGREIEEGVSCAILCEKHPSNHHHTWMFSFLFLANFLWSSIKCTHRLFQTRDRTFPLKYLERGRVFIILNVKPGQSTVSSKRRFYCVWKILSPSRFPIWRRKVERDKTSSNFYQLSPFIWEETCGGTHVERKNIPYTWSSKILLSQVNWKSERNHSPL